MSTEHQQNGRRGFRLREHYVICNWNSKIIDIVEQLHHDVLEDTVIVIVTTQPVQPSMLPTGSTENGALRDVVFYPGDPTRRETLENVNCSEARAVIVLADETLGVQADARNLLTLFALSELKPEGERPPHFVIEILDVANYSKFQQFEEDEQHDIEIIRAESLRTRILAQAARTPGLVSLYHDLLTYSKESNEIYSVDVPHGWIPDELTFGRLSEKLLALRDAPVEPVVCIPIGLWKRSVRTITTNPPDHMLVERGDRVVIICREKPILERYG